MQQDVTILWVLAGALLVLAVALGLHWRGQQRSAQREVEALRERLADRDS